MSSWSLLLAASGYEYDGPSQVLRFTPRITPAQFKSFFCGPEGWGSLQQQCEKQTQRNEIRVVEGELGVAKVVLGPAVKPHTVTATLAGTVLATAFQHNTEGITVSFDKPLTIKAGTSLVITVS